MSAHLLGFSGILIMMLLIFLRMPIGFAMTAVGCAGLMIFFDGNIMPALGTLGTIPYATAAHYSFTIIPLFVLMGLLAFSSGISTEVYQTAKHWLGHWPGGLSVATVGACAGFSAVSGSSIATAAALGTLTIPEMRKAGVNKSLATGVVAAGGTLGIMIPPSGGMVLYALITDQSIGKLLIAGIIPGLMLGGGFILACIAWAVLVPGAAPRLPKSSWRERFRSLKGTIGILVLFLVVMGGIYGGVFTVTEAASIGALGSFLISAVRRKLTWENLRHALLETGRTTCMIFMIVIGAHIFNVFLSLTDVTSLITDFLAGLNLPVLAVLFIIMLIFLGLGCILDTLAMIVLIVPIILPTVLALGMDPIWFGVIVVLVMEMGLITPPIGINVFVIKGIAPDVPLPSIFKGILPFLAAQLLVVSILILFPDIALWLPNAMGK